MVKTRGSQFYPRVYEILVILASKYMGIMGDSGAIVRDSALILGCGLAKRRTTTSIVTSNVVRAQLRALG